MTTSSCLAQCNEPGLLIVLTRPRSLHDLGEFHDWYDTEHGPLRMKLDFIRNGHRYQTADQNENTIWAASYDVDRLSALSEPIYMNLRKYRSPRERQLMATKVDVLQRKLCRLISSKGRISKPASVIMNVSLMIRRENLSGVYRWYEKEHLDMLTHTVGWHRSRHFEVMEGDASPEDCIEVLVIHEFDEITSNDDLAHIQAQLRSCSEVILTQTESCDITIFNYYRSFRAQDYRRPPHTVEMMHPASSDQISTTLPRLSVVPRTADSRDSIPTSLIVPAMAS